MSEQLVGRAQAGDHRAFEELIVTRIDRLYATASLALHDAVLAEDAVQECLIRAWGSLPSLRDPGKFDPWLRRVLVHACLDAARGAKRQRAEAQLPTSLRSAEDLETAAVERDAVTQALLRLSTDHRAAFVLRHYLGLSVPEVAEALRIRLGTAKSRLHYAERAMAAALDGDDRLAVVGATQ
jgi:RNA polymerase sigma-70 factor (ECF subfamily)